MRALHSFSRGCPATIPRRRHVPREPSAHFRRLRRTQTRGSRMKPLWFKPYALEDWEAHYPNTLLEHLGIKLTEIGPDYLRGTMPVDRRTHQPQGLLHGGASVALAETLGSIAANMVIDRSTHLAV